MEYIEVNRATIKDYHATYIELIELYTRLVRES